METDLSKRFISVINRVEPKYGCMVLDMLIDDIGEDRAGEILELSEGMMKYKNYLTENEAMCIADGTVYYDNSKGAKWKPEDVRQAVTSLGGKCDLDGEYNFWSLYATMLMKQSDEWGVLKNYVEPSKEALVCYELARASLLDKDGRYNVRRYFEM